MIRSLDHFHQRTVSGAPGNLQSGCLQLRQQVVVHFVAMTVPLDDALLAVAFEYLRARFQAAFLRTQTHGAAGSEASVRTSVLPEASAHSVIRPTTG